MLIANNGEQLGVFPLHEALQKARQQEMDLVLMSDQTSPPVCKILDFKKRVFEKKKQLGSAKKNSKRTGLKEIKFRPDTDQGDYNVKTKRLVKFLEAGDRVKVTIRFRGREIVYKERGYDMLTRIEKQFGDMAEIEQKSKLEGKLLTAVFKSLLKPGAKRSVEAEPAATETKPAPQPAVAANKPAATEAKPPKSEAEAVEANKPAVTETKPAPQPAVEDDKPSAKPQSKPQPPAEAPQSPSPVAK